MWEVVKGKVHCNGRTIGEEDIVRYIREQETQLKRLIENNKKLVEELGEM